VKRPTGEPYAVSGGLIGDVVALGPMHNSFLYAKIDEGLGHTAESPVEERNGLILAAIGRLAFEHPTHAWDTEPIDVFAAIPADVVAFARAVATELEGRTAREVVSYHDIVNVLTAQREAESTRYEASKNA
jgi:hypothetical protein